MPVNRATEIFAPLDRGRPLRGQIEAAVREAIGAGGLAEGGRLPASRVLAEQLHVSRGVVSEAYAQLAAEGWIEVRRGSAPVVRAHASGKPARPAAPREELAPRLDLRATAPDLAAFPRRAWGAALRRVVATMPDGALDYGDARGDPGLREELAAHLVRVRGAAAAPDALVVTAGYTQALWLVCRVLAGRGVRRIAVEDPSLDDNWATIRSAGLEPVPLAVDADGARVDALARLPVEAVLVTPAHQFPTGAVLAPERRRALLEWSGLVLEDDYDSEYRYDRAPVGTLQRLAPDRVVHIGTASKTLAPALRLGWLLAPGELAAAVARERWPIDSGGEAIGQRVYARLLAGGEVDRHLRRTRREYRRRRDVLVERLAARLPECRVEGVAAGLHLLLRLPDGADEAAAVAALAERRIRIRGLAGYRLTPGPAAPALVVGYGRLPEPAIPAAVDALREAVAAATRGSAAAPDRAGSRRSAPPSRPASAAQPR
jgi:GntR family transcriptional regulator/MocR family aminotransferase